MATFSGVVIKSTGSWYLVEDAHGDKHRARLRGKFKLGIKEKNVTNPIAVGDQVVLEPEQGGEDTVAIVEIAPRSNYLIRSSVHKRHQSHILAANLDVAVLVATLAMPRTSLGFIDRFLVSAEAYRIPCAVVLNKMDLVEGDADSEMAVKYLEALYPPLGYPLLRASAEAGTGLDALRALLDGKTALISGHSGVGKSSLVNRLSPGLEIRTSEVSTYANKGTHTTTFAERHTLWPGTHIVDTPGIKELGLAEMAPAEISHYFPEMRRLLNQCRYDDCLHLQEPGCRVRTAVDKGEIYISRYESYLSMMAGEDNRR